MLIICQEGGLSLQAGLKRVADELRSAHPVLGSELKIVDREIQLGKSPGEALQHFAQRTDLEEALSLASVVGQSERFGASLVKSLRTHSETLRIKRKQKAEEKAQKAATKILIPTLLFIFPAVFVVLLAPAVFQVMAIFERRGGGQMIVEDRSRPPRFANRPSTAPGGGRRRAGALALLRDHPDDAGIWEIGCLLDAQQTLVEAVREGGRQASTGLMTNAQVQQVVLQYLSAAGVNTSNVVVTVTNTGSGADASQAAQLDPLVVSASLPFKNVDWSFTQKYVSDSSIVDLTSCQWYSMKDAPYAVPRPAAPARMTRPRSWIRPETRGRPIAGPAMIVQPSIAPDADDAASRWSRVRVGLIILLFVIFGIIEFGQLIMARQLMNNAARSAARVASAGRQPATYPTARPRRRRGGGRHDLPQQPGSPRPWPRRRSPRQPCSITGRTADGSPNTSIAWNSTQFGQGFYVDLQATYIPCSPATGSIADSSGHKGPMVGSVGLKSLVYMLAEANN